MAGATPAKAWQGIELLTAANKKSPKLTNLYLSGVISCGWSFFCGIFNLQILLNFYYEGRFFGKGRI